MGERALGYSDSRAACEHEEPVRCDSGESDKDPFGKIGAAKREAVGQDDGGADAGTLLDQSAVGGGRSGARKGSATRC